MSTPKEAAEALNRLNGADIRTYQLEVSYALVQRSGCKPLMFNVMFKPPTDSIEDRTKSNRPVKHRVPVLSSRVAKEPISAPSNTKFASLPAHKSLMESNFTPDFMSRSYSQPQADFNHGFNPYVSAFAPNATSDASTYPIELANQICLVIKNLPIMIVKSDAELRMFIQSLGPVEPFRGNMFALPDSLVASAIVTFMSPSDAVLVMHAINGKYIGGNLIEVNHTTNTPNRIQDMGWVPAMEGPKNVRRSVSEKKPLKIPAFGETPRFFSAPHDRYTFTAPIPQNKVTTIIGEGKTSSEDHSTTSLESLLERSELIDEHKRLQRQIHTSETGDSSFLDASLSTNEVSSPSNASAKNFLIHGSPSVESPIFNTRSTTEHIKDKENYPIIDRSNSRFNID
ncbi:hypothetical protein E3Q08_02983 [Wallemia mellicola]|nr:hypothetical protein E3Q08_02983 [Wallemia mellicola]